MQESFFRCPEEKCGKPMIWTIHRWVDSGQVLFAIYRLEELPPSYHKDPVRTYTRMDDFFFQVVQCVVDICE